MPHLKNIEVFAFLKMRNNFIFRKFFFILQWPKSKNFRKGSRRQNTCLVQPSLT